MVSSTGNRAAVTNRVAFSLVTFFWPARRGFREASFARAKPEIDAAISAKRKLPAAAKLPNAPPASVQPKTMRFLEARQTWIPAFAGMTALRDSLSIVSRSTINSAKACRF
jgi:hypothetical protein